MRPLQENLLDGGGNELVRVKYYACHSLSPVRSIQASGVRVALSEGLFARRAHIAGNAIMRLVGSQKSGVTDRGWG